MPVLRPVTDPETLSQLGGNDATYKRVTNPETIKQLNQRSGELKKSPLFSMKQTTPLEQPNPLEQQQEQQKMQHGATGFIKGASQSVLNTPEEIANVFGKHMYNKFNYAPKTSAAEAGKVGGDIASYFLPGGAVSGLVKGAKYAPAIADAAKILELEMKEKPIANFLFKGAKNAGEAMLFEKAKNPLAQPADVGKAGIYGAGLPAAINAFTSSNPIISSLAKLGVGAGLGYHYNGLPGVAEGVGAAFGVPKILKEVGFGQTPIAAEMLTREQNPIARSRYEAGQRIGDVGTPAEVFADRGAMARAQGKISHSETGAEQMAMEGEKRIANQQGAIKRLLDTIYPKAKGYTQQTRNLYKQAGQAHVPENDYHDLMENHVISQAAKEAAESPLYQEDLKDVSKNSVAYLDVIKKVLDDKAGKALTKEGGKNAARIYETAGQKVIDAADNVSPLYKEARASAQRQITRQEIQKAIRGKPITGQNFFNKVLANDHSFDELIGKLKNVPEAQQQLKDMRLAWEHLVGMDTTRSVVGRTAGSTNLAREDFTKLWNSFKDLFGAPRDVERAKFIHDPKWWDKFDEVMKYRNKQQRNEKLGNLIGRGLSAGAIEIPLAKK